MFVRNVMNRRVITIGAEEPLGQAAQKMVTMGIRHLPVLRAGSLIGILSERDVLRHRANARGADPLSSSVAEAMSTHVITIGGLLSIGEAAKIMSDNDVGCLPVMDGEDVVGIITVSDLVALHVRLERESLAKTVTHHVPVFGPDGRLAEFDEVSID